MGGDDTQPVDDDDDIQCDVGANDDDRHPNRFFEAADENGAERCNERERDGDGVGGNRSCERILHDVRRRIGRGQRDGDHKRGGGEPQEA